jgi:23S rRNA pseudouridine1911/1915/1917 synthase
LQKDFQHIINTVCTSNILGDKPYTFTYKKNVKKQDEGKTLLDFYATAFPYKTELFWQEKIEKNHILVNDKKASPNLVLKAGWITKHLVFDKTEPKINTNIQLLFQDQDILVINKPAPIPVHPSGRFYKNTVTHILKLAFPKENFKIVHRLDANTTGILILAKNKKTANFLIEKFKNKKFKKQYIAIIEGSLNDKIISINTTIGKEKSLAGSRVANNLGQKAETNIKIIKILRNKTVVELEPKDGRTNQLRLHLASIQHPIIGDIGYKDKTYFKENAMTYPTDCLLLHAWKISFDYKGKYMQFEAPIPDKFKIEMAKS